MLPCQWSEKLIIKLILTFCSAVNTRFVNKLKKTIVMFAEALVLTGVVLLSTASVSLAYGEHSQRLAANLLVLQGDLRQLLKTDISDLQRQSLSLRIEEKLGMLELLVRSANQQNSASYTHNPEEFRQFLFLFNSSELTPLLHELESLSLKYPLVLSPILQSTFSPVFFKQAEEMHLRLCSGCHSGAMATNALPAFDLFKQSRSISRMEFVARMLTGLRGDQLTSLQNPLTDTELSALISFYRGSVAEVSK
jgi:hypothetical protein